METKIDLQSIADYFADAKLHDLEVVILEAKRHIEVLEKALEIYERERNRWKHAYPEYSGEYFLAGGHGDKDNNFLPQFIEISPAYGAGWVQVYEKIEKTISYEGS